MSTHKDFKEYCAVWRRLIITAKIYFCAGTNTQTKVTIADETRLVSYF